MDEPDFDVQKWEAVTARRATEKQLEAIENICEGFSLPLPDPMPRTFGEASEALDLLSELVEELKEECEW